MLTDDYEETYRRNGDYFYDNNNNCSNHDDEYE